MEHPAPVKPAITVQDQIIALDRRPSFVQFKEDADDRIRSPTAHP